MAGRSTPFGLFSGCSLAKIGEETRLELAPRSSYERSTRIDFDYLNALSRTIDRDERMVPFLKYRANTTGLVVGSRLHYVETRLDGDLRVHELAAAELDDILRDLLEFAAVPRSGEELTSFVARVGELGDEDREECRQYVLEAIQNQILVADFGTGATGGDPLEDLAAQLVAVDLEVGAKDDAKRLRDLASALHEARRRVRDLDARGFGLPKKAYADAIAPLQPFLATRDGAANFQVDLFKPLVHGTISSRLVQELIAAAGVLRRMLRTQEDKDLVDFRKTFADRYGDRPVRLFEALDDEAGIGFRAKAPTQEPHPLIDGLPFDPKPTPSAPFGPREDHLLRLWLSAMQRGEQEIVLTSDDIDRLTEIETHSSPDAFCLVGNIMKDPRTGADRFHLQGATGPSGASLLGRFCNADPELTECVKAHLAAEEALAPEAVYAEIVHLPDGRAGNVLYRPCLRKYEIEYLGRSGLPAESVIPASDLWLSLRGDRLVLWSERLGVEVRPRLTSAYSGDRTLPVHRLLLCLQTQGVLRAAVWDWGAMITAPFLPRVVYKNVLLSRAVWNLAAAQIRSVLAFAPGGEELSKFRQELRLPRIVAFVDGENVLPIDLDNPVSFSCLQHLLKGRDGAIIAEYFADPSELGVSGPEGRFVNEVSIPCVRTRAPSKKIAPVRTGPAPKTYFPGSEWEYAKIYAGPVAIDRVLCECAGPLLRRAVRDGAIDSWFFLRYADPEPHLRIRCHGQSDGRRVEVLQALLHEIRARVADFAIWKVQLDTYEPEVERYGGPDAIEQCERLFWQDSECCLSILSETDEGARWIAALLSIDALLGDFGLNTDEKKNLVAALHEGYARDMRVRSDFRQKLGARYRVYSGQVRDAFASKAGEDDLAPIRRPLLERSRGTVDIISALKALDRSNALDAPISAIASSLVHMTVNRLLRSANKHEIVLYDFLRRQYASELAYPGHPSSVKPNGQTAGENP
jgi:thiopeptide-type bacteriocin biosynthesis protein